MAIGAIYRLPKGNFEQFCNLIENSFTFLTPMVDDILCLKDFNINLFNRTHSSVNAILSLFDSYSLTQIITEPTRITPYSETLIDFIVLSIVKTLLVREYSICTISRIIN